MQFSLQHRVSSLHVISLFRMGVCFGQQWLAGLPITQQKVAVGDFERQPKDMALQLSA